MKESRGANAPKRVLYVITKATWGGAQRYVFDLAQGARAAGYEVTVAYGEEGLLGTNLAESGIRTVRIDAFGKAIRFSSDFAAYRSLVTFFRQEQPDIVHINSSKAGALGALAARKAHVPRIIFTAHAWAFNEDRPWWQRIIFKAIHASTIIFAHTTICVSDAVRRDMTWVPGAHRKLIVVRNGVHESIYKERADARRALWSSHEDGYWVGMLSELHPTKRVTDAVTAITLVRAQFPYVKLVVLGDGAEHARIEKQIQDADQSDAIRLAGFVPEGSSYLKAFDMFLHTSRTEALAYAVIEAGSAGLPVVATDVGGVPEIIEHKMNGVLVPREKPLLAAAAIAELIRNPAEATAYGEALHAHVASRFTVERMVRETLALY